MKGFVWMKIGCNIVLHPIPQPCLSIFSKSTVSFLKLSCEVIGCQMDTFPGTHPPRCLLLCRGTRGVGTVFVGNSPLGSSVRRLVLVRWLALAHKLVGRYWCPSRVGTLCWIFSPSVVGGHLVLDLATNGGGQSGGARPWTGCRGGDDEPDGWLQLCTRSCNRPSVVELGSSQRNCGRLLGSVASCISSGSCW